MPDKYIWDKESGPEFQTTLASIPFQDKIKSFLNQNFENSEIMVDSGHCPLTGLTGQRGFSYILYILTFLLSYTS
jgi:hypothetical protein